MIAIPPIPSQLPAFNLPPTSVDLNAAAPAWQPSSNRRDLTLPVVSIAGVALLLVLLIVGVIAVRSLTPVAANNVGDKTVATTQTPAPAGPDGNSEVKVLSPLPIPGGGNWISTDDGEYEIWVPGIVRSKRDVLVGPQGVTHYNEYISILSSATSITFRDGRTVRATTGAAFLKDLESSYDNDISDSFRKIDRKTRVRIGELEGLQSDLSDSRDVRENRIRYVIFVNGRRSYVVYILSCDKEIDGDDVLRVLASLRKKKR